MAEEADLYDDLFPRERDVDDASPFQSFHKSDTREEEFRKKEAELNGKVELLQTEVEALQQEKAVLTRNISCLFKTAQLELARKDKQMKELRDENLRFKTNARPHLKKAAPVEKILGEEGKNHHTSGADGRQDKRLQAHSHVTAPSSEADPAYNSEESRPGSSERRRVREYGHRQTSLDEGKPDTAHDAYKNSHSDSRAGDKLVRHGDHGHSKGRSPDQRSRGRNSLRKRQRSLSKERDEDSGAAKSARERRSTDHSHRSLK